MARVPIVAVTHSPLPTLVCPLQVLGHSKTVMVLLGGFLFLGEHAGPQKILGMVGRAALRCIVPVPGDTECGLAGAVCWLADYCVAALADPSRLGCCAAASR